jgi:bifunctional DNA-binding transcriptional regulator/antitoxin component of YhaV-PrlF toxin-antitoxin module
MLAELRTKSQITLPRSIVTSLGLTEGDKLDITERDGVSADVTKTILD